MLFGYHQKQHNSQTLKGLCMTLTMFGYHQKQHNSQTNSITHTVDGGLVTIRNNTTLKLVCSDFV